jgi:hypothetical protein
MGQAYIPRKQRPSCKSLVGSLTKPRSIAVVAGRPTWVTCCQVDKSSQVPDSFVIHGTHFSMALTLSTLVCNYLGKVLRLYSINQPQLRPGITSSHCRTTYRYGLCVSDVRSVLLFP